MTRYMLGEYAYNKIYKILTRNDIYQYVLTEHIWFLDLPENFRTNRMLNDMRLMCELLEDEY
jgi:hypothetical protein